MKSIVSVILAICILFLCGCNQQDEVSVVTEPPSSEENNHWDRPPHFYFDGECYSGQADREYYKSDSFDLIGTTKEDGSREDLTGNILGEVYMNEELPGIALIRNIDDDAENSNTPWYVYCVGNLEDHSQSLLTVIQQKLDAVEVHYESISLREEVLVITLISEGKGRCTKEDVESVGHIYDALCDVSVINYLDLSIVDVDGNEIYNLFSTEDFTPGSNHKSEKNQSVIIEEINTLASPKFTDISVDLNLSVLNLTVHNDSVDMVSLEQLYSKIERYGSKESAFHRINLTLEDNAGQIMIYMTGDVRHDTIITWIAPEVEESIVGNIGPQSQ